MKNRTLIIIVTYNGERWIRSCLDSLIVQPNSDVYVIDCNSSDNTTSLLKSFEEKIIVHFSDVNLGFGKANNYGLRYAIENEYGYVFLVNQDTICEVGIIDKLKEAHKNHLNYGILSPLHFYDDNTLDKNFESYLKNSSTRTISMLLGNSNVVSVDFVNAAFWFIPRETIQKIGGFDPIFNHYGEDDDFANRVIYNNKLIGIVTNAFAYHLRDQNSSKNKDFYSLVRSHYNSFLVILKNPTHRKHKALKTYAYVMTKRILYSIFQFQFKNVIAILYSSIRIVFTIRKIFLHREMYNDNTYAEQNNICFQNNLFIGQSKDSITV